MIILVVCEVARAVPLLRREHPGLEHVCEKCVCLRVGCARRADGVRLRQPDGKSL